MWFWHKAFNIALPAGACPLGVSVDNGTVTLILSMLGVNSPASEASVAAGVLIRADIGDAVLMALGTAGAALVTRRV